jgi:hypothetical protein
MEQNKYIQAASFSAAFAIFVAPALALAQVAPERGGGSFNFGWVILLFVIAMAIAVIWFTMSQRRGARHTP